MIQTKLIRMLMHKQMQKIKNIKLLISKAKTKKAFLQRFNMHGSMQNKSL